MAFFGRTASLTVSIWLSYMGLVGAAYKSTIVTTDGVDEGVLATVVAGLSPDGNAAERIRELEDALRPTYIALPKNAYGRLDHSVVRYALHRLMVQQHGWYIKGLEPNGTARNDSSVDGLKQWVPQHLHAHLDRREGADKGLDLIDLAAMATMLERLVHNEALSRLEAVYNGQSLDSTAVVESGQADELLQLYIMGYLQAGNYTYATSSAALTKLNLFRRRYPGWTDVVQWISEVQSSLGVSDVDEVGFAQNAKVAEELGARYAALNDLDCHDLKATMLSLEDSDKKGRVRMSAFYGVGLHSHWNFTEKVDYLRVLGALDETVPGQTSVIIPNYLASRPNCLEASTIYAVCCRNECEDLLAKLEVSFQSPLVLPELIAQFVVQLQSDTVMAPWELSSSLRTRLQQIAEVHDGRVPLHGRLFAQWMHHAFPRECPFPHDAASTSPQTPDEWLRHTGQETTKASEEEMQCHVSGPCSMSVGATGQLSGAAELPWSETEELLVAVRAQPSAKAVEEQDVEVLSAAAPVAQVNGLNRRLRSIALAAAASGVGLASKLALSKNSDQTDKQKNKQILAWMWSLVLLFVPLMVLTVDFFFDFAANDLLKCVCALGVVAALVAKSLPQWMAQPAEGGSAGAFV